MSRLSCGGNVDFGNRYAKKDQSMSTRENDADHATQGPEKDAHPTSPEGQAAGRSIGAKRRTVHEADIFPPAAGARYFGTGSYEMGGTHAEGSDALGELNPTGGYGTFNDAGGPGSTTLYGEEELPPEPGVPPEGEAAKSSQQPPGESG